MDLYTLIRENIRCKKGTFISILILMFISAMSLTLILSVDKSCNDTLDELYEQADSPDFISFIREDRFDDTLKSKLDSHKIIERYTVTDAIATDMVMSNGMTNGNTWYLSALKKDVRLVNDDGTGYEDDLPELNKGEMYISFGAKSKMDCKKGDKLTMRACGQDYQFTVKGFVAEPMIGSMNIGWKWNFISDEDLAAMRKEALDNCSDENGYWACKIVQVYRADDCDLSDGRFRRQINLDTGLVSKSWGSITKDMSTHYTNIYCEIIMGIMFAFIMILVGVVMIVMWHSISSGIEMDYTDLGILKAQGFSSRRIRAVFVIQYLFAELIGSVLGFIAAIPLIGVLTGVFDNMSGFIAQTHIAAAKTAFVMLMIFIVSTLFILLATRKIGRITPMRAIQGGKSEIYFDSRLKAPIGQKCLSALLALRQFTSSKRRYAASIVIASLLIFFMLMINGIGDSLKSKKAAEMMGGYYYDVELYINSKVSKETCDEIVKVAEKHADIRARYFQSQQYLSINGEEIICQIRAYPEDHYVSEGRACKYDNEILITDLVADELDLKIGDTVTVTKNENSAKYIITGFYPSMADTGKAFCMSFEGAEKMGIKKIGSGGFNLNDPSKASEVAKAINDTFGTEAFEAKDVTGNYEDDEEYQLFNTAVIAMKTVIYSFSVVFALIVISMVCSKAFTQEKTDIGIYKSQGFTSKNLRLQFAVRFLIVAIIGSAIGTTVGLLFTESILSVLLKTMGVSSFYCEFSALSVMIPIGVVCLCFFLFAYFVSRKIKKVGIRQLVTE